MRPLLDLRDPAEQATLKHVTDIRRALGKTVCGALDVLAEDPGREWTAGHVAQRTRMVKPVAKLALHALTTQGLAVKTRGRYQITMLGATVARVPSQRGEAAAPAGPRDPEAPRVAP